MTELMIISGLVLIICITSTKVLYKFGVPMLFTWVGTKFNITEKPKDVDWLSVFSVSLLAGIGFTMSIFVSEIAFKGNEELINISKISILSSAVISVILTYIVATIINFYKKKGSNKSNSRK